MTSNLAAGMAAAVALVRLWFHVHARSTQAARRSPSTCGPKDDRMQFMAITVVFFTVVNAVKLIPLAIELGQLSLSNLATSLVLMLPFCRWAWALG